MEGSSVVGPFVHILDPLGTCWYVFISFSFGKLFFLALATRQNCIRRQPLKLLLLHCNSKHEEFLYYWPSFLSLAKCFFCLWIPSKYTSLTQVSDPSELYSLTVVRYIQNWVVTNNTDVTLWQGSQKLVFSTTMTFESEGVIVRKDRLHCTNELWQMRAHIRILQIL